MEYIKITIDGKGKDLDLLAADLMDMGMESVEIVDPETMVNIIENQDVYGWDYVDEKATQGQEPAVLVYLEPEEADEKAEMIRTAGYEVIGESRISDEDWVNSYKDHFRGGMLTDSIMVRPSWEDTDPPAGVQVLELDPGMAFGTGDHETTFMCARLLEKYGCAGKDVLDVGTGSGILAIAAHMLGARAVLGVDIDPEAVRVSKENGEKNHCPPSVKFAEGDLVKGLDFTADVVTANLVAEIVLKLAESIGNHIKKAACSYAQVYWTKRRIWSQQALRKRDFP